MSDTDEPVLGKGGPTGQPTNGSTKPGGYAEDFETRIRALVKSQPFGVLCTQGEAQPYGSVVAVAFTDDLRHALFATPVTTRKYRLLSENDRVAMVVDDRSTWGSQMMQIEAVTLTGRATHIPPSEIFDSWAEVLVRRHPQLQGFVRTESCALFRIDVLRYFHVERFQEVREWSPQNS